MVTWTKATKNTASWTKGTMHSASFTHVGRVRAVPGLYRGMGAFTYAGGEILSVGSSEWTHAVKS